MAPSHKPSPALRTLLEEAPPVFGLCCCPLTFPLTHLHTPTAHTHSHTTAPHTFFPAHIYSLAPNSQLT